MGFIDWSECVRDIFHGFEFPEEREIWRTKRKIAQLKKDGVSECDIRIIELEVKISKLSEKVKEIHDELSRNIAPTIGPFV